MYNPMTVVISYCKNRRELIVENLYIYKLYIYVLKI